MDDRLRQELSAWFQFYREIGLDPFYRRSPGDLALPRLISEQDGVTGAVTIAPAVAAGSQEVQASPPAAGQDSSSIFFSPSGTQTGTALPGTVPRTPAHALNLFEAPGSAPKARETLEDIRGELGDCRRCKLAPGRRNLVFGEGNPKAAVVFIGEGPGADEDEQGLPFVGRAGQLLNRMLQFAGIKRQDVYVCNIVKCRPPGNRTPEPDEVETCSPFLFRQLQAISPRLICCLGAPAVKTVLGLRDGILKIRGKFYDYGSCKALPTVHPAYVLRNPREEKLLREDFEKISRFLSAPR